MNLTRNFYLIKTRLLELNNISKSCSKSPPGDRDISYKDNISIIHYNINFIKTIIKSKKLKIEPIKKLYKII